MDSKLRCVFEFPEEKKGQSVTDGGEYFWNIYFYLKSFLNEVISLNFTINNILMQNWNLIWTDETKQSTTSGSDGAPSSGIGDDKVSICFVLKSFYDNLIRWLITCFRISLITAGTRFKWLCSALYWSSTTTWRWKSVATRKYAITGKYWLVLKL